REAHLRVIGEVAAQRRCAAPRCPDEEKIRKTLWFCQAVPSPIMLSKCIDVGRGKRAQPKHHAGGYSGPTKQLTASSFTPYLISLPLTWQRARVLYVAYSLLTYLVVILWSYDMAEKIRFVKLNCPTAQCCSALPPQ